MVSCSKLEREQSKVPKETPPISQCTSETQIAGSSARRLDGKPCMKKIDMKKWYEDVLRKYGDVNDFGTESLINLMDSKKPIVRAFSALLLGERKERSAIPKLEAALRDESLNVREDVTKALLKMGNRKGIAVLQEYCEEVLKEVQNGNYGNITDMLDASEILADAGEVSAVSYLRQLMKYPDSWGVRLIAVRSLSKLYEKDASVLTDIASMLDDEHPQIRTEASEILQRLQVKK